MKAAVHLSFMGKCDEAFGFYETVFGTRRVRTILWGDAPAEFQCSDQQKAMVMHTAMPLGTMTLMGSDSPPEMWGAFAAFDLSLELEDEAELRRLFSALSEGGSVTMAPGPMFWTPLFAMCRDRFGVDWMLGLQGTVAQGSSGSDSPNDTGA